MRRSLLVLALLAVVVAVPLTVLDLRGGSDAPSLPVPANVPLRPAAALPSGTPLARVIVVIEENHEYDKVLGSRHAGFIDSLAREGTLLTSYHAISHPSLPNYLALLGGDTFGITSDCTGCHVDAPNLVDQLEAKQISWRGYFQGLPAPCSDAATNGAYAKKHNPFMYFDSIRRSAARCGNVVPIEQLGADVAAGRLPQFALVVPDLQHDMHDGSIATADRWVADLYRQLTASSARRDDTRVVLTFDEGDSDAGCCDGEAAGGRTVTIISGPHVRAGVDATPYSHYSLLRSIEERFGLPLLGHAARPANRAIPALG